MDQALYKRIMKLHDMSFFKARNAEGEYIVNAPWLKKPIASAFERLTRFEDPTIEIGRLGIHGVHIVCCGLDVVRDGLSALDELQTWTREGAINVHRMAGGRC